MEDVLPGEWHRVTPGPGYIRTSTTPRWRARGVNLRVFSNEAAAIAWLMSAKASSPFPEAGLHT